MRDAAGASVAIVMLYLGAVLLGQIATAFWGLESWAEFMSVFLPKFCQLPALNCNHLLQQVNCLL